jgi:hypothetical protein
MPKLAKTVDVQIALIVTEAKQVANQDINRCVTPA